MITNKKMKQKKNDAIIHELYRRAFAASTPQGDWDKMLETASFNEFGEKDIPFMDYELEQEVAQKIIDDVMKEYRVPKHNREAFATTYWFGCSPKTKIESHE